MSANRAHQRAGITRLRPVGMLEAAACVTPWRTRFAAKLPSPRLDQRVCPRKTPRAGTMWAVVKPSAAERLGSLRVGGEFVRPRHARASRADSTRAPAGRLRTARRVAARRPDPPVSGGGRVFKPAEKNSSLWLSRIPGIHRTPGDIPDARVRRRREAGAHWLSIHAVAHDDRARFDTCPGRDHDASAGPGPARADWRRAGRRPAPSRSRGVGPPRWPGRKKAPAKAATRMGRESLPRS